MSWPNSAEVKYPLTQKVHSSILLPEKASSYQVEYL